MFGKPFGLGESYYPNGNIFQSGLFSVKGMILGSEYNADGTKRFEGIYRINRGYGPNYPVLGICYEGKGIPYFRGHLTIRLSGIGYPFVIIPTEYGPVITKEAPRISYMMWDDFERLKSIQYL